MEEISKIFNIDESSISYSRELEQLSINNCEVDTDKILDTTKNLGTYKTIEFSNVSFKHFNLHKLLKNFGKVYNNNLEIKSNIIFKNCKNLEHKQDGKINDKYGVIHFNNCELNKNMSLDFCFDIEEIIFENIEFDILKTITLKYKKPKTLSFKNIKFNYDIEFVNYEIFNQKYNVKFIECEFKKDFKCKHLEITKELTFSQVEFKGNADFSHCEFKEKIVFNNSIFYKLADFSDSTFFKHAYFPWIHSKRIIHFYNTNFKEIANFYFAIFEYVPNFSTCAFEKTNLVNLIGVDLSLIDIGKIKQYTKKMKNKDRNRTDSKNKKADYYYLIQHAQGARDSFRTIKNVLIAQSNLLESQKWHQLELYAKEVELCYRITIECLCKKYGNSPDNESQRVLEINRKNKIKNVIDRFLLCLYKTTSNHHSDLLLIVFTTLSVIGGYYLFSIAVESCFFGFNCDIINIINYGFYFLVSIVLCCIVFSFIECYFGIKICLYGIKRYVVFALIVSSLCGIIQAPSIITPFIGVFSDNAKNHFLNKAIINLKDYQAINIANRLNPTAIYLNESQAKKDLLANKDIIKEDELILNAYNEALLKGKNADEFMTRINIIYYILMILCLFSLQKTARKNSIIPN